MFKVRLKTNHDKITTVYDIKEDLILKEVVFLVFNDGYWFWSRAEIWEPLEMEVGDL